MGRSNEQKQRNATGIAQDRRVLHQGLGFTASEQYRLLRANLQFTLPENEGHPIIGITSSVQGEGKSTTSVNLAYMIAEAGKKILLIDGDLRRPSIARLMDVPLSPGLTELLMKKEVDLESMKSSVHENWYVCPAGSIPPNPSELLGSGRMQALLNELRNYFDVIIIDLPPVTIVSDALAVSPLITGMVVVIREEHTRKRELAECLRQLSLSGVNVLGCVLNNAKVSSSYSKGGSYYYGSGDKKSHG